MLRKTASFLVAIAAVGGIYAFNSIKSTRNAQELTSSLPPAGTESRVKPDAPMPTVVARTYTVREDDRLPDIARQFNVSSDELVVVNNIKDPDRLRIGQSLKIPAKKTD